MGGFINISLCLNFLDSNFLTKLFWVGLICGLSFPTLSAQMLHKDSLENAFMHEEKDSIWTEKIIDYTRQLHRQQGHSQEKEINLAQKAADAALAIQDTLLYAKALDNMGLLYRYHEWYRQALPLHIKAFELVQGKSAPPISKMIFANNAGLAARYDQQYVLSVSYYLKSLKLAQAHHQSKNIAISSNGLGNAMAHISGKDDEAFSYFQKALKAEKRTGDSLGMAMNLLSISEYYIKKGTYKKALKHLHRLKAINTKRKDTFGLAITNESYARLYIKKGWKFKAQLFYTTALKLYQQTDKQTNSAKILHNLGDIQFQFHHFDKALQLYNRSLKIADSLNSKKLLMENAYSISAVKERTRDYSAGLAWYKKGKSFEDSIAISQQKTEIEALDREYNLNQKENEVKLLEKEQELSTQKLAAQKAQMDTRKSYFIITLIGIIILISLLIIQYHNWKTNKLANLNLRIKEKKILQAEYEKNLAQAEMLISRLQVNPHFIFNCLNAANLLIQKKEYKKAKKYLVSMSRFIRMILELPTNSLITLAEELELIHYYIKLEEIRFDQSFYFSLNADPAIDLTIINISPLLLQPFVENAIWHGLLPSNKDKKILNLNIQSKDNSVKISIEDNGVGRKNEIEYHCKDSESKKSLGMCITKERIRQFNEGLNYKIDLKIIDKTENQGTRVVLLLKDVLQLTPNFS